MLVNELLCLWFVWCGGPISDLIEVQLPDKDGALLFLGYFRRVYTSCWHGVIFSEHSVGDISWCWMTSAIYICPVLKLSKVTFSFFLRIASTYIFPWRKVLHTGGSLNVNWREKNRCRSIYKFSGLDFVAMEAKKMVAKGKKISGILGISQEPGT